MGPIFCLVCSMDFVMHMHCQVELHWPELASAAVRLCFSSRRRTLHLLPAVSKLDGLQADAADAVRAYFGMRKISLGTVGNETNLRPLLNNEFVFHMGMLDQVSRHLAPYRECPSLCLEDWPGV